MANKTESDWLFIERDPVTHKSIYIKVMEDGQILCRETIPMWLAQAIIDQNTARSNAFSENGGWSNRSVKKYGASVADIPDFIDTQLKLASGFDPLKGGQYDKDKYNSFLDDRDYAKLRTGGGRIGKRRAWV